ncbi:hypothetical protein KXW98_002499 [Aspergillus fumigatus]|nr:hypothetical protein CNMCM8714_008020 [Aspergillus fumigatus]KMK58693.1 RTA1 domain-containing protein [Aspergillus fumigatus Z5]KAF4277747.1 hypothetical protein CNMCM8057_002271 [Aspergillus fumigatus]KAF4288187.1 hypothetical protein CNMCM8689_006468 [Aspergillus fumigatus]KAF4294740.1 hypothetical protein CNMCM8686_002517 [Aspergillus fumigatus]
MIIAVAMEAIGFISRSISAQHVSERTPYVLQFSLIILAPVLMAACCYILFGRILFHVVPPEARTFQLCWVPPRFITPIFVGFDIVALLLQLGGAVLITSADGTSSDAKDKFDRGRNIALIGVIVQMVAFGLFSLAAFRFNFTSKRFAKPVDEQFEMLASNDAGPGGREKSANWNALLRVVNFSTLMILIRSVYRLVEFTEGKNGYINLHEWCLYVFDALPIFPCAALFVYWHPAKYLPYLGFRLPKHAR